MGSTTSGARVAVAARTCAVTPSRPPTAIPAAAIEASVRNDRRLIMVRHPIPRRSDEHGVVNLAVGGPELARALDVGRRDVLPAPFPVGEVLRRTHQIAVREWDAAPLSPSGKRAQ